MVEASRKFKTYFLELYESNRSLLKEDTTFEDVFKTNKSRIEFVNYLFNNYRNCSLSYWGTMYFEKNIDYVYSFINGKEKESSLSVPKKYFNDSSKGSIIPTIKEVEYLLKIISRNSYMYETIYANNPLYLKLPDDTFNQNMTRILEIKRKNIAHLLGLTEHEDPTNPNPQKNLLKKHFLSTVKDLSKYNGTTESEKLLSWITSKEGQDEILRIHNITLNFIQEDSKKHPHTYDGLDLKQDDKVIAKFKERYKQATGLDFPIINYSRLITKSINALNFFKLSNLVEIILDYNAPIGKCNEKDIFLVNRNSKKIHDINGKYISQRIDLLLDIHRYAFEPENQALKNYLLQQGINVNSLEFKDKLNIIRANSHIGKHGIKPRGDIIDEKITSAINDKFPRDIHLVGFGTEFGNDKQIPLNSHVTHYTHCDTAISLTAPELLGHYYKYGRSFFLDKIDSKDGVLMVSNINDEIYYLKRMSDIKANSQEECIELVALKRELKNNYKEYSRNDNRRR